MDILKLLIKKEILPISLILILTFSRLIPHLPNFTPLIAMGIISGYFFKNIYTSLFVLLLSMLLADVFIGFYYNMIFVYLSLLLIAFIFFKISDKINYKNLFICSLVASFIFFIISNFGVWFLGNHGAYSVPYEKNISGLIECYMLAIPFFLNTLLSTIIFSYCSFLVLNIFEKKLFKKIS